MTAAADPLPEEQPLLAELYAASVRSRIAMGGRTGLGVLRVGQLVDPEEAAFTTGRRCTMIDVGNQGAVFGSHTCAPAI